MTKKKSTQIIRIIEYISTVEKETRLKSVSACIEVESVNRDSLVHI